MTSPEIHAMRGHTYAGEYRSAIVRAKKVLIGAGFLWSNPQRATKGVRVRRVGCSDTVAIHVYTGHTWTETECERADRWLMHTLAIVTLRDAGLPFDDRGWLACGRDAARANKS